MRGQGNEGEEESNTICTGWLENESFHFCGDFPALVLADLVDLALQIVHHLGRHLIAEDLEQIDALVAGNRLVGGQLDALLDLDGGR